ncbi:uncharacterized protein LOC123314106 [Coccinella septempunctata]|uniref:uncharacterized protein LOC123314106 n=1 Tax=Coccinella septempunctata TaxID=41139 RepID=UPI001D074570|nr:uncharacterized protein LOC123314106 [Coccinella septempunctata]
MDLAQSNQSKKKQELDDYKNLLNEIESWIVSVRTILETSKQTSTESQIQEFIIEIETLHRELLEKERKLVELSKICKEFQKYADLKQISLALCTQLESILTVFTEQKTLVEYKIEEFRRHLEEVRERRKSVLSTPDTSLENTLNSISMPIEEVSIHSAAQSISEPLVPKTQIAAVTIETQTGNSLKSPTKEPSKKDFTVTYNEPVDAQIQAQLSKESVEWEGDTKQKETITISKFTTSGGEETIQIDTKPMASQEPQPLIQEPDDDLLVEASYKKQAETDAKSLELNITNTKPNQPFETVMVEPDETTTEVIVDADGSKRIIVKKLHRTVVRHQQTVQQQNLTSLSTLTQDNVPITQSFSQVTLQGQQSSTTVARGDGRREILTNRQYGGNIISGTTGGDINVQEFSTDPETHYTVIEAENPKEVEIQGVKLHEGDVAFVDEANKLLSADQGHVAFETSRIQTSSSSVRAVVQQVTRKVIRKTRRIIRKIVIVDGKEQITEEVVEEPEEVEITEEGIPRVSINVTETVDGTVVSESQYGQPIHTQTEAGNVEVKQSVTSEPIITTTSEDYQHIQQPVEKTLIRQEAVSIEPIDTIKTMLPTDQEDLIVQEDFKTVVTSPSEKQFATTSSVTLVEKSSPILEITDQYSRDAEITEHSPLREIPQTEPLPVEENSVSPDKENLHNVQDTGPIISEVVAEETDDSVERYVENQSPLPLPAQHVTTQTSFEVHKETLTSCTPVPEKVELEPSAPAVENISIEPPSVDLVSSKEQLVTEDFNAPEMHQDHPIEDDKPSSFSPIEPEHQHLKSPQSTLLEDNRKTSSENFISAEIIHHEMTSKHENDTPSSEKSATQEITPIKTPQITESQEVPSQSTSNLISEERKTTIIHQESPEKPKNDGSLDQIEHKQMPAASLPKTQRGVEITVSLEEKPMDWKFESAKISSKISVDSKCELPEEKLQRESDFSLPSITKKVFQTLPASRHEEVPSVVEPSQHETSITSSEIDHGGRKSKRKKKSKTPEKEFESPDKKDDKALTEEMFETEGVSLETTLSESTDIIIPSDSQECNEESPKPTFETLDPVTESDQEERSKDTGYEADKTTVDESLMEDNDQEKKKRRKKKKKQKVKVKDTDESHVPISISDSVEGGESVVFSDDDKEVKVVEEEEKDLKKKKRRKVKKEERRESESEPVSEPMVEKAIDDSEVLSEPITQKAIDEELDSVNDSYQTISTASEVGTVKVIEESVIAPSNEKTEGITSEIVTKIPVIETVLLQEENSQTSPELISEIATIVETMPASMQTSPEIQIETAEFSIQTDEASKQDKPIVVESSSQVELSIADMDMQTSPREVTPDSKEKEILDNSMQTTTPERIEIQEEFAQTEESISPKWKSVERSDTSMQTFQTVEQRESQTSPIKLTRVETVEVETQARQTPEEHYVQTSPLPSAPPMEDVCVETEKESFTPSEANEKEREEPTSIMKLKSESIDVETQANQSLDVHYVQTSPVPSILTEDIGVETDKETSPSLPTKQEPEAPQQTKEDRQMQTSPTEPSRRNTSEVETQAHQSLDICSTQTPSVETDDKGVGTEKELHRVSLVKMCAVETTETASQVKPIPADQSSQTSSLPSSSSNEVLPERKIETLESITQTSPTPQEIVQLTPPSSPSEYEVLVQASISIPTDVKENAQPVFVNVDAEIPHDTRKIQKKEGDFPENIEVQVSLDDVVLKKHSAVSDFIENEKLDAQNQEVEPPMEGMVVSSIVTDLNEEKVEELRNKSFAPRSDNTEIHIKLSLEQEQSGSSLLDEKPDSSDTFKVESVITETTHKVVSDGTSEISEITEIPETHKVVEEDTSETSEITETPTTETESTQETVKTVILIGSSEQKNASLEPVVQKTKISSPKTKTKNKHVTSVTIEEVQSPHIVVDTPLTPSEDFPISPPVYPSTHWSHTEPTFSKKKSEALINSEKQESIVVQNVGVTWSNTQTLERIKNLQNAQRTTHLSDVLYLATLSEVITEESIEQRSSNVEKQLKLLQEAVERRDVQIIQQTIITTVETITTWLETIEYRIYVSREQTSDGPSEARVEEFNTLKDEIVEIEDKIGQLQTELDKTDDIYNEDDKNRMKSYIDSLQQQVKIIEDVTEENGQLAAGDLRRWNEFVAELNAVNQMIIENQETLNDLKDSDAAPQTKLNELDALDSMNKIHTVKSVQLLATAKGLLRDFPTREIPNEVHRNQQLVKQIEQQILTEREKAYQFLTLADEYEQTLKEFSKIVDIAEAIVDSSLTVKSLEHLENEMQNHRKFFVNLSHCRAILESLEENLDSETKAKHSELHTSLYERATIILDRATGRFQLMFSAASKWATLEQGMKEEMTWLQVLQERIPYINNITSLDYRIYMNHYLSLSQDIADHHAALLHLKDLALKVQELVVCSGLEQEYTDALEIIKKLEEDVHMNLQRIAAFRDNWNLYKEQSKELERWLNIADSMLEVLERPEPHRSHMRQFWELKAECEVNNKLLRNVTNAFETSMTVIPIADEMSQRNSHSFLLDKWNNVSSRISNIEEHIMKTISAPHVPVNKKLAIIEEELEDLKSAVEQQQGVMKCEEELNLYIERLQIRSIRLDALQNELGKLGLLSANESDKVTELLALSKRLELQIAEELEGASVLKDSLRAIQKGIDRLNRKFHEMDEVLNHAEEAEKLGSAEVQKAVNDCHKVDQNLVALWQDVMSLRQLLHTLPMRLKATVSPVTVEREISNIQERYTSLERRCGQLLALLRGRLNLWQRFERQLEMVQESVQEADFMMDVLTIQGTVDYDRLRKATERLESVSSNLVSRENLVEDLKESAKPLSASCTPEVSEKQPQEPLHQIQPRCRPLEAVQGVQRPGARMG